MKKHEIWKDIIGCKYHCQISNLGRFKTITSYHKHKEGTITIGSYDTKGYLRVYVNYTKNPKAKKVHRLVAEYFLDTFQDHLTVNHINFNKSDNNVDNLEMLTSKDNSIDYTLKKIKPNSSSKTLNVSFHKKIKKWTTKIYVNKKYYSLGTYSTEKEAIEAVELFKKGVDNRKIGKHKKNKLNEKEVEELLNLMNHKTKVEISKKFKISYQTVFNIIKRHENNLTKIGPDGKVLRNPSGKILKPSGFIPVSLDDLVK